MRFLQVEATIWQKGDEDSLDHKGHADEDAENKGLRFMWLDAVTVKEALDISNNTKTQNPEFLGTAAREPSTENFKTNHQQQQQQQQPGYRNSSPERIPKDIENNDTVNYQNSQGQPVQGEKKRLDEIERFYLKGEVCRVNFALRKDHRGQRDGQSKVEEDAKDYDYVHRGSAVKKPDVMPRLWNDSAAEGASAQGQGCHARTIFSLTPGPLPEQGACVEAVLKLVEEVNHTNNSSDQRSGMKADSASEMRQQREGSVERLRAAGEPRGLSDYPMEIATNDSGLVQTLVHKQLD